MDEKFLSSKITLKEVKFIFAIIRWHGNYKLDDLNTLLVDKNYIQMFDIIRNLYPQISPDQLYGERKGKNRAVSLWHVLKPVLKKNRIRIKSFMDFGGTNCHTAFYMGKFLNLEKPKTYCVDLAEWAGMEWKRRKDVTFVPTENIKSIKTNSLSCIHASHTLHHATDKQLRTYINEFYRIIHPGGIFILYEHNSPNKYFNNLLDIEHALFDVSLTKTTTLNEFKEGWISNYKSKVKWDKLFKDKFKSIYVLYRKNSINKNYYCIYKSLKIESNNNKK